MNPNIIVLVIAGALFPLASHAQDCSEAQWGGTEVTYTRCGDSTVKSPVKSAKMSANTTVTRSTSSSTDKHIASATNHRKTSSKNAQSSRTHSVSTTDGG